MLGQPQPIGKHTGPTRCRYTVKIKWKVIYIFFLISDWIVFKTDQSKRGDMSAQGAAVAQYRQAQYNKTQNDNNDTETNYFPETFHIVKISIFPNYDTSQYEQAEGTYLC